MKRFEKCLKIVLDRYSSDAIPLYCPSCPEIDEQEFRLISAKGLITLLPNGDDTFYAEPTADGITYFHRKREDSRLFWREHIVNFVGGFVSGVLTTILASILLQRLL